VLHDVLDSDWTDVVLAAGWLALCGAVIAREHLRSVARAATRLVRDATRRRP